MEKPRKITVEITPELLEKAQQASATGHYAEVRTGLQLVAAADSESGDHRSRKVYPKKIRWDPLDHGTNTFQLSAAQT